MGTIVASTIIDQAHEIVQDIDAEESAKTWTTAQAIRWINEGQLAICGLKDSAKTANVSLQLTANTTKQTVTGRRVLSVIRNMGTDGNTPGRAIRLVERAAKDESDPDWHVETPASTIKEYVLDDRDEKTVYVSPPPDSGLWIEVLQAVNPVNITDSTDTIDIEDIYSPALLEWVLYRFFGRDSEETPNYVRANGYLRNFYQLLGIKAQADMKFSPKTREHLK